jgi:hypothetical protein
LYIWLGTQENQQPLTNTFMETTTAAPRIFHLKGLFISKSIPLSYIRYHLGFSNRNSGQQNTLWQNNANSQPQSWQSKIHFLKTFESCILLNRYTICK